MDHMTSAQQLAYYAGRSSNLTKVAAKNTAVGAFQLILSSPWP